VETAKAVFVFLLLRIYPPAVAGVNEFAASLQQPHEIRLRGLQAAVNRVACAAAGATPQVEQGQL
jgi:hypothetical protein